MPPTLNPADLIKQEAAKCVACGLCLPHCPTYNLLHDESESPRGRLLLMQALAKGDLTLSARLESHLTRCLVCRACEKACPSYVGYGQALDSARALIETLRAPGAKQSVKAARLLRGLAETPGRVRTLGKILRLYQLSGLQKLLRTSRLLRLFGLAELEANLAPLPPLHPLSEHYPAQNETRGRIVIFTGCMTPLTDNQTLTSSIRMLNRLGYSVHIPPGQRCCGALHQHDGQSQKALELMRQNILAFGGGTETVLGTTSGCTATLREYGNQAGTTESVRRLSGRVMDINQFIAGIAWPAEITFRPLNKRIAVQDPCTMANVLRQADKPYALLSRIPGAKIIPLPENTVCCGAAGTYHLTQPEIARPLRAMKMAHLRRLAPDILVTSNSGCATYLAAGIREAGLAIEVIHPVVLLDRQLEDGPGA